MPPGWRARCRAMASGVRRPRRVSRAHVLERAFAAAPRDAAATDDAALVERTGVTVRLVADSPRNLKVTTPEDLALAELLARHGE